jgi:hypothetical protein
VAGPRDYTIGRLGDFPRRADIIRGWGLAEWLRAYARLLRVSYVIFQGRIWSASRAVEGWRPYGGATCTTPPTRPVGTTTTSTSHCRSESAFRRASPSPTTDHPPRRTR